jgi:hypothetical protein
LLPYNAESTAKKLSIGVTRHTLIHLGGVCLVGISGPVEFECGMLETSAADEIGGAFF